MKSFKKILGITLLGISMLLYLHNPINASANSVLGPDVTNYINSRSGTVAVAVYDANTGQTYTYNSSKIFYTQSVVKMAMMANVLDKDTIITSYQNTLLTKAIVSSDNSSASALWRQLGSDSGVQGFFNKVGLTNTKAGTGGWWGRTTTNVLDQITLMKLFAYPNSFLTNSQRAYGLNLMRNVQADQRWGTGYGPPAGVSIALKNGWITNGSSVNSLGYVNGQGKDYIIAVFTASNPSFSYAKETINTISSKVWNNISRNGWALVNGKWYFYKESGKATGWLYDGNKWYFLDSTGAMKTGWVKSDGSWYYLKNDGAMKTGWVKDKGEWYFLDSTGAMETGWIKTGGKWYYLQSDGKMKTGWLLNDDKWYYLKSTGEMRVGWLSHKNTWYYLNNSGAMETDWVKTGGKWYYLQTDGKMKTGWLLEDDTWYYLESNGQMRVGWLSLKDKWYFLTNSGAMEKGWLDLSGKKYYFTDNGDMVTGWQEIEGKWYYFYPEGHMAANTFINGYKLGEDGEWIQVSYVALGDSLASGMTPLGQDRPPVNGEDPDWGYPNYIAETFEKSYQLLNYKNFGVAGYTTDHVIADLEKEEVQRDIKNATHLTIDIGANDLLSLLKENPAEAITGIATISEKIGVILETIDLLNPNVEVYIMGYYNPYPYITEPQQKEQLNQLLQALNAQIQGQAAQHGDTYVPTSQVINVGNFADYIPNPENIHLSLLGYQVVAKEFWEVIE